MRSGKIQTLLGAVLVVGLLSAGCGTDGAATGPGTAPADTGSAGSSSNAGAGAVRGVTDAKIRIAGVAPVTSATGGYPGVDVGAAARFDRANREGGINGRQIEYLGTRDDNENGAKNLEQVRKAVLEDNAFAIVPALGQGFLPATGEFLGQQQVPSVGWGFMPLQCSGTPTLGFGFNGCIVPPSKDIANLSVAMPILDELGGQDVKVASVSDDNDTSRTGNAVVSAAFVEAGADVVYSKSNVPTSERVDYTPFVQDIMTSNGGKEPDLVVFNGRFANTVGIIAGLKAAGYKGATANYTSYVPGLLEAQPDLAKSLEGAYVITQFLPTEFSDSDAIEQMNDDVETYKPGATVQLGTALSYWMADVFLQMLEAAGPDLSPPTFDAAVNNGWTYQPEGTQPGLGPISFPVGHSEPAPCAAMVQVKGRGYDPVTPMTCYRNVKITK